MLPAAAAASASRALEASLQRSTGSVAGVRSSALTRRAPQTPSAICCHALERTLRNAWSSHRRVPRSVTVPATTFAAVPPSIEAIVRTNVSAGRGFARGDRLERADELRGGEHGVPGLVGHARVTAAALDDSSNRSSPTSISPARDPRHSEWHRAEDVRAERLIDAVEGAVGDHRRRTGADLLGGLEQQAHPPRDRCRCGGARSAVAPSSALVCASWPHACMRPGTSEPYGRPGASCSGNASMSARSSSVGPGRAPRRSAITPVPPTPRARLESERPQALRHELGRSVLGEGELGLAVQRPAGLDQLRLECGTLAGQLLRHAPEDIPWAWLTSGVAVPEARGAGHQVLLLGHVRGTARGGLVVLDRILDPPVHLE